ncbi:MAG: hypothetical protein AAF664_25890 [Planctomycetota bacterium]
MTKTKHRFFALAASLAAMSALSFTAPGVAAESAGAMANENPTALDGYCAVCVVKMKAWEKGDSQYTSMFDGQTYQFPNAEIQAKFDASPEQFAPVLGGDCIVCYQKMGKRVTGSVQHSSLYEGRLYLFPSDAEKQMFESDPNAFASADVALGGDCAVCLAKMGKHVPGSSEFAVTHNGLRYLFPSAKEASMFRQMPDSIVAATMKDNRTSMKSAVPSASIQLVGASGCAGCEHGIRPLASPNELGLAIKTDDGRIFVIEEAHKLYPERYKARFNHERLSVEGKIVKTEGRFSWLQPSNLTMTN